MKFVYWQSDIDKRRIVRQDLGIFEQYYKENCWVENPERFDIVAGIDPYYTETTEEEAMQIIEEIERETAAREAKGNE